MIGELPTHDKLPKESPKALRITIREAVLRKPTLFTGAGEPLAGAYAFGGCRTGNSKRRKFKRHGIGNLAAGGAYDGGRQSRRAALTSGRGPNRDQKLKVVEIEDC